MDMEKFKKYSLVIIIVAFIVGICFVFYKYSVLKQNNINEENNTIPQNIHKLEERQKELNELEKQLEEKKNN